MEALFTPPSREAMPETAIRDAYGFDVLDGRATRATETGAQVWFEIETVAVEDQWGKVTAYEPRVMFRMRSFADTQAVFSVPKTPAHEQKYPRAWAKFVKGQEDVPDGTPIDELPRVSRMTRETLRAYGVQTIEQAAALTDQIRERLGLDGERVKEIARAWLKKEAEGEVADYASELAAMRAQMKAMQEREAAMAAELAATKGALTMIGAAPRNEMGGGMVAVESDPDYSGLPGGDALAGDGDDDDDGMDALLKP